MKVNEALEIIQGKSVAMDILFGNSPQDMAIRAMENQELSSVVSYLESNPSSIDFILVGLRMRFHSIESENSLNSLGSVAAFFEVLRNFPSSEVVKLFDQALSNLSPDNFLRNIIKFQFENIRSKSGNSLNIGLKLQFPSTEYQIMEYQIKTTSAGDVQIRLN